MAYRDAVELYKDLILPKLAEGPATTEQLDVPLYALQKLQAVGHIASRTFRLDDVGVRFWCLYEDYDALKAFDPEEALPPEGCF